MVEFITKYGEENPVLEFQKFLLMMGGNQIVTKIDVANLIIKGSVDKDSINREKRIFSGWGSVEIIDRQGDYLPVKEFEPVMDILMQRGAPVTDSHSNHVVGRIIDYKYRPTPTGELGLYLTAEIYNHYPSDEIVWQKIQNGEYTGFSLGGKAGQKVPQCNNVGCYNLLSNIEAWEFSIVERPANQLALIDNFNKLAKSDKDISKEIIDNIMKYHYDSSKIWELGRKKVYIKNPSEVPEGAQIKQGPSGGYFYWVHMRNPKPEGQSDKPKQEGQSGADKKHEALKFAQSLFTDTTERGIKTRQALVFNGGNLESHIKDIRKKIISLGYKEFNSFTLDDEDNPLVKDGVEINFANDKGEAINVYMRTDGKRTAVTFDETPMDTGGKLHTTDNIVPDKIKQLYNKNPEAKKPAIDSIATMERESGHKINPKLAPKLKNAEIQTNKILDLYDKFSKSQMSLEDKYLFVNYLIKLYNKADQIANIKGTFNVESKQIDYAMSLMLSNDIHDKAIGVDNFMALTHTTSTLLADMTAINNGIDYTKGEGYNLPDEDIDSFFGWRAILAEKIEQKLNEIRNRQGLGRIKYIEMSDSQKTDQIIKNILKTRIYVENPSQAPQGVRVQEGKYGGLYYDSRQVSTQAVDEGCPPDSRCGQELKINQAMESAWEAIQRSPHAIQLYKVLDEIISGHTSKKTNIDETGQYTPERRELHGRIIEEFIGKDSAVAEGEQPIAIFVGGPPASGKTTLLNALKIPLYKFVMINSDDIKARLPGYNGINAMLYHDEAHDIVSMLLQKSINERRNIIIDGTMKNPEKEMQKIQQLKKLGYNVKVISINTPPEISIIRAAKRFLETSRYIPLTWIAQEAQRINDAQIRYKGLVEDFQMWDSSTYPPRKIL